MNNLHVHCTRSHFLTPLSYCQYNNHYRIAVLNCLPAGSDRCLKLCQSGYVGAKGELKRLTHLPSGKIDGIVCIFLASTYMNTVVFQILVSIDICALSIT